MHVGSIERGFCAGGDLSFDVLHVLARQIQTVELVLLIAKRENQIPISCLHLRNDQNSSRAKIRIRLLESLILDANSMTAGIDRSVAQQRLIDLKREI